jgi:hypothetical protein
MAYKITINVPSFFGYPARWLTLIQPWARSVGKAKQNCVNIVFNVTIPVQSSEFSCRIYDTFWRFFCNVLFLLCIYNRYRYPVLVNKTVQKKRNCGTKFFFGGTITLWAISRDILRGPRLFWPLKLSRAQSLEMAHKVIVPPKKNYIPQFLKQRDINSYKAYLRFLINQNKNRRRGIVLYFRGKFINEYRRW